ncbi:holin [Embleya sp. NPDC050154]|uniref:holin n=1 Tax=Embleya sp. NPDC050154 TaxID=3363988 RepID=UPI00378EB43A
MAAPMETKVKVAGAASYLGFAALLGVLTAVGDAGLVSWLPDVVEVFVAPMVPTAITMVAAWKAKHTPRPADDTTTPGYLG